MCMQYNFIVNIATLIYGSIDMTPSSGCHCNTTICDYGQSQAKNLTRSSVDTGPVSQKEVNLLNH